MDSRGTSRWLQTGEAAEILGVTQGTVIEYIEEGLITAVRYGERGYHKLLRSDVEAFIQASVVGAGTKLGRLK